MKLLIISPSTQRGGTEEYVSAIASAAAQAGWNVHAAFPKTEGTVSLIGDLDHQGVGYHRLDIAEAPVQRGKTLRKYLPHLAQTLVLLLKLKPDVVQVNVPIAGQCFGSLLACGFLKIPTAVVFHLMPSHIPFNRSAALYHWLRSRNQQWIAVSENNRQLICESFQISPQAVLCIYNGTQLVSVQGNREEGTGNNSGDDGEDRARLRAQVRQELGLPEASQLALTVGRLTSQKGHRDLLAAIPHLVREFPAVRFIWVGEGEDREELMERVRACGVQDSVLLLGYRADVPRLLKAADLFVFPTHYEGHPLALLEAMTQGLPIVASDASSIPEIIQHGVQGLLFRTGDRENLLATLRWALQHPDSLQEMAGNAQQRVQDFSVTKTIKQTLNLFRQLTGLRRKYCPNRERGWMIQGTKEGDRS
jgi:glycosyltransferase involved in cell wall biosynthesis